MVNIHLFTKSNTVNLYIDRRFYDFYFHLRIIFAKFGKQKLNYGRIREKIEGNLLKDIESRTKNLFLM